MSCHEHTRSLVPFRPIQPTFPTVNRGSWSSSVHLTIFPSCPGGVLRKDLLFCDSNFNTNDFRTEPDPGSLFSILVANYGTSHSQKITVILSRRTIVPRVERKISCISRVL